MDGQKGIYLPHEKQPKPFQKMEQILKDFVRNALVDNPNQVDKETHVVGSDLLQLKHVVGGELTDKQKFYAMQALCLLIQSRQNERNEVYVDEELLDRQITDFVDGIVTEMPEDVKEESILRCRLEYYDMATAEDFNADKHHIKITDRTDLKEGAELILFECDGWNYTSSAVLHQDGTLFVLTDWQCGRPESIEELDNYEWGSTDGHHGIVVNGLPRYIG